MGLTNKTDKLDAKGLAILLRNGTLPEVWIPPSELRDQRESNTDLLVPNPSTAFRDMPRIKRFSKPLQIKRLLEGCRSRLKRVESWRFHRLQIYLHQGCASKAALHFRRCVTQQFKM